MTISEEIIKVLDYLAEKFGIVIDKTSENLIPYMQTICEKLVNYETYTSIAYIVIYIMVVILLILIGVKGNKAIDSMCEFDEEKIIVKPLLIGFLISISCIFVDLIREEIFDIIECQVFPEKYIIDYISQYLSNH